MEPVVAVLGAGNGGQALAGHLALKGCSVRLFEHPDFGEKISHIKKKGGIDLRGSLSGFGKLDRITVDAGEALDGARYVFLVAPSFAQRPIMEMASPHLGEEMMVVLIPGNFGSLEAALWLGSRRSPVPLLGETNTLPYACRQIEPGTVDIWGIKTKVLMAAFPANRNRELIDAVSGMFPTPIVESANVLETGFSNLNMVVHCPTMIMNAGRIESEKGNFRFYTDGMSPSVCKVVEGVDAERISIGRAIGLDLQSQTSWLKETYALEGETLYDVLQSSPVYGGHGSDAPKALSHRYLTEDVPYLLVPVASFGRTFGIQSPLIDSVICLAGSINDRDFLSEGRTMEKLGFSGYKPETISRILMEGFPPTGAGS
jgi:opine dehydrogenase